MSETKGDTVVLDALSGLYKAARVAQELACRQKHRYLVKYELKGLFKHFLCLLKCCCCEKHESGHDDPHEHHKHCEHGHCIPCWVRCALNRIERLGGDADSTMVAVTINDEAKAAFNSMIDALRAVCDAANLVILAAMPVGDHPSKEIASKIYHAADCDIAKFEALLRQDADSRDAFVMQQIHA